MSECAYKHIVTIDLVRGSYESTKRKQKTSVHFDYRHTTKHVHKHNNVPFADSYDVLCGVSIDTASIHKYFYKGKCP